MARHPSHPFDALAERFAQIFAERVSAALPKTGRNGVARRAGGLKRDMHCRYPGCKNRSKGPRFRFLCEEHLKLPKKKQEGLVKWAAKNTWFAETTVVLGAAFSHAGHSVRSPAISPRVKPGRVRQQDSS